MKKISLVFLIFLLLFHNPHSHAHPFSWLVDSCKEYAHQFNDLDTWKKAFCVLVGVVALDKCVSITKGTWDFLFGKPSQPQSAQPASSSELTSIREESRESKGHFVQRKISNHEVENESEEDDQDQDTLLNNIQVKKIFYALREELKKDLMMQHQQLKLSLLEYTLDDHRLIMHVSTKTQENNRKIKDIIKQLPRAKYRASTHEPMSSGRPADVPPINLSQLLAPKHRPRTRATIITMPPQDTLQRLQEQTSVDGRMRRALASSSDEDFDESSSSSSDDDDVTLTEGTTTSHSSARTSLTATPHNLLDSERMFCFDEEENKYKEELVEGEEVVGYKLTPRAHSPLATSQKTYTRNKNRITRISTKPVDQKSNSAPASLARTPRTTRFKKSRSMGDLNQGAIKKSKKKLETSEPDDDIGTVTEPEDFIVTEDGEKVSIPSTPVSAKDFVALKDSSSDSDDEKDPNKQAAERFYYDKKNCGVS